MAAHINRLANPKTDNFQILKFDHLEFTVGDAVSTMKVFKRGLGMELVGQSSNETGNYTYASYVLKTHDVKFVITAPYLSEFKHPEDHPPNPTYDSERAKRFFTRHGVGVSACGVEVADAAEAYKISTQNGAKGVLAPTVIEDKSGGKVVIAEIDLYGDQTSKDPLHTSDTVIRFIQYCNYQGPFLPGYQAVTDPRPLDYGIIRIDHVVGNVYNMDNVVNQLKKWIGFHTFAKFSKEEIQTPWTALNSEVLASNNERVLFPINEPAPGKKESQITEYLKAYNGPGVQHIAMKTNNVLAAVKVMSENSDSGFEFMKTPASYYQSPEIAKMMKENLTEEEADAVIELGILIDKDDEGILLQIFTKPLFDRATIFIEIIQRKCMGETIDIPGCGGFGKGNFKALFEAIERLQEARGGLLDAPM
jgi:4-hydroxyphenylpyruvate dioxygenase